MGVVKNWMMEMEEYDEPYDCETYANFCDSYMVETSIKIIEESIKDKDRLFSQYEKACNNRTGYPDFFTPQDIEIELMELRSNPPQYLPEDEARIIPCWYKGIRHLAERIFKAEEFQRFVIPSRHFYTYAYVRELLPKSEGIYIVWAGGYDYSTAEEQVLWYVGMSKNVSIRWRKHHQSQKVAVDAENQELYKVYFDFIPASSLAFSLRVSELVFLEELKARLELNQRF